MTDEPAPGDSAPRLPETPFVGLVPYGEEDAAFFFGRGEESQIVAGNLRASGLTLLYGASGVGKSSLLRAGAVHDLHADAHAHERRSREGRAMLAVCVFSSWRDGPLAGLMATIRAAAVEALGGTELPPWQPGDPVVETLRRWTEPVRTILVVLDQFEDYFLYHPAEEGDAFGRVLPEIVNDPNLRVHVLLSIREDALAQLDRFKGHIPRLFANYVRIEHLDRAAARRAIEGPVEEWNRRQPPGAPRYTLEPALVEAVLAAATAGRLELVQGGPEGAAAGAPHGDRVEAPFLQLLMERLWRSADAAGSYDLTVARLEELGGAERIVESHLLDALGRLTADEQAAAADLFRFLVTRSKAKIAHEARDLAEWTGRPEPEITAVLEKLCRGESGRILRPVPPATEGGALRYELFHDVLAEPIAEWRREHDEARRRRAAYRRFALVGGGLLALAGIFAALGVWALVERSQAQSATRSATSLALASAAREQVGSDLAASLLLGLEAYRARPSAEAASALVQALEAARRSGAETILRGGRDGVRAIAFSPDGSTLASADLDGSLHLWDTDGRTTLGEPLLGHTGEVWSLSFGPDGTTLASAGLDGTIRLWDVAAGEQVGEPIEAGPGGIRSVAFAPDGRRLAASAPDDTIRLWDVATRAQVGGPLRGHEREVVSLAFGPDGRTLVSGGYDRTVRLWDVSRGAQAGVLQGHEAEVWAVAFAPDGRTVASGDRGGSVRLWDVAARRPLGRPLESPPDEVWGVAFSPDGRTLASTSFDDAVRLWDAQTGKALGEPMRGHTAGVVSVAFRRDGLLASAGFDGTIRVWDPSRRPFGAPLLAHTNRVKSVAFAEDGLLASAGFDGTIRLWESPGWQASGAVESGSGSVENVAVSLDGRTLAAAGVDGSIGLWELPGLRPLGRLQGHRGAVQSVAFDPAGGRLASAGFDGSIRLWDTEALEQVGAPLEGHEGPVWGVAFGPSALLVSAGSDGTLVIWDAERREPVGELPLGADEIPLTVAFSDDGRTLAAGTVGGLVRLWDVAARRPLGEPLRGHQGRVESVAFGPDGSTLASASDDATVRLWHVEGRRPLGAPLLDHEGPVFGIAFARDGRVLASGSDDRTVRVFEGVLWRDLADLEAQVCRLVVRSLTEAEWDALVPGLAHRTTCET